MMTVKRIEDTLASCGMTILLMGNSDRPTRWTFPWVPARLHGLAWVEIDAEDGFLKVVQPTPNGLSSFVLHGGHHAFRGPQTLAMAVRSAGKGLMDVLMAADSQEACRAGMPALRGSQVLQNGFPDVYQETGVVRQHLGVSALGDPLDIAGEACGVTLAVRCRMVDPGRFAETAEATWALSLEEVRVHEKGGQDLPLWQAAGILAMALEPGRDRAEAAKAGPHDGPQH